MDFPISSKKPHQFLLLLLLLVLLFHFHQTSSHAAASISNSKQHRVLNNTISAIFVFGDSSADPGNNNYVRTVFKGNFPPYGRDFPHQIPTGRFTNGRLTADYIISYVGIKDYIPPYLDPTLSLEDLMTGVSFASAGSGFDPLTSTILRGVIPMTRQLEYFKEYKKRVENEIGREKTANIIKKAVFLISAGTNDFVVNYFSLPVRRNSFTVSAYQNFVLQHVKAFIEGLSDEGAGKIAMVGLPPIGCLPLVMTLNSFGVHHCLDKVSTVARDYNKLLQIQLRHIQSSRSHLKLYYADTYGPLQEMIQDRQLYGFEQVSIGCCGTGLVEASVLCNPNSFLCADASKYMFWDSIHPTEKTYYYIFQSLRPLLDFLILDV